METESEKEGKSVIAGSMRKNHVIYWINVVMVHPKTGVVEDACSLLRLRDFKRTLI